MSTLSETTFQQLPAPTHPTAGEVEDYRSDAHRQGLGDARQFLLEGSPMLAFLAVVRATEDEAQVVGLGRVEIPTMGPLGRLPFGRLPRRAEVSS